MKMFYSWILVCTVALSATGKNDLWKGNEYAKNSESQKSSAEDFIEGFHLDGAKAILDVGCGDGKITAAMARMLPGAEVIGVDISPSMIGFANASFTSDTNLKFLVLDAASIDYQDKFDLITSFTAMQWILDQSEALNRFEKALKMGGRVCIQMPTGLPVAMDQALNDLITSERWATHFIHFKAPWKFYQPEEYRDLLTSARLTPTRINTVTKHERFNSLPAFQGFLRQWFPYIRPLPAEEKDIFLTELIDRYLEILPVEPNGQVSFIVTRLEVEAKK